MEEPPGEQTFIRNGVRHFGSFPVPAGLAACHQFLSASCLASTGKESRGATQLPRTAPAGEDEGRAAADERRKALGNVRFVQNKSY